MTKDTIQFHPLLGVTLTLAFLLPFWLSVTPNLEKPHAFWQNGLVNPGSGFQSTPWESRPRSFTSGPGVQAPVLDAPLSPEAMDLHPSGLTHRHHVTPPRVRWV